MEMVNSAMQMVVFMMVIGNLELWMAMETSITPIRNLLMKANGRIMRLMVKEKSSMKNPKPFRESSII